MKIFVNPFSALKAYNITMASNTFNGVLDRYSGVTIDSQLEPCDTSSFQNQLTDSLKQWTEERKRCIWFKVNIKDAAWVPILANEGFNFHHSRDDFVMMYKWLPTDCSHNLPPACHTNIGVGGMVFNDKNQILVVSEKSIDYPHWKLPGGYVERSEDIQDAAVREIREETGIESTFESMITFRHSHNSMFGNSDIYVVVKLRADSTEITKSDIEISACKWMKIEEFISHPHVHEFNRFLVQQALDLEKRNIKLGLVHETLTFAKMTRNIVNLVIEDL